MSRFRPNSVHNFGWYDSPQEVEAVVQSLPQQFQQWETCAKNLDGTGAGKKTLLYLAYKKVTGRHMKINQGQIGSCVAASAKGATDELQCIEILLLDDPQQFKAVSIEAIYGFSRVEIGGGRLGRGDGSTGAWWAKSATQCGFLTEEKLGPYDVSRCREWGYKGVPDELEPEARQHVIGAATRVQSWEQVRDAIHNGYPVTIASNYGFGNKRDAEGFCRRSGSWAHQMRICAVDEEYRRPGACVDNTWDWSWISGPLREDQPPGSFWVDADVIDQLVKSGDCWAISAFKGFEPREINVRNIF